LAKRKKKVKVKRAYKTKRGAMWHGRIEDALEAPSLRRLQGKVDLIFTSPPYPLVFKKKYGNKSGDEYLQWLKSLAPKLAALLSPKGSIVIEIGNAWEKGSPEMSTLPVRSLLAFQESAKLVLCQHLIWHNSARLPSPAEWVTVRRIRLKDSFTHVWWMSKTAHPTADNKRVLVPYSADMRTLLDKRTYNAGKRPSGHSVSKKGFLKDHGGAIAPSVIPGGHSDDRVPESLVRFSNTHSDADYVRHCREKKIDPHPARMPMNLAGFVVELLTKKNGLVFDPFAGSNITGAAAEALGRRWVAVEAERGYIDGSKYRFRRRKRPKLKKSTRRKRA
jgi:DNA modification methylase